MISETTLEPQIQMNPVPQKTSVPSPEPIKLEEDFSALFDEQSACLEKSRSRANYVIFAFIGLIAASGSIWYAASVGNRRIVADLIMDIKSSGKDFEMIAGTRGMAGQYDKALDKIGTRSSDIDEASVSLGVDPFKVQEDGMESEMKEMMGGEGVTVGDRNRMLENGMIGKMAKGSAQKDQKPTTAKEQVRAQ